ncbi:MAG TPA: MerR family transcriptional regulator [Clostridia bacterium]
MLYTVKEIAELAKVTVKTLHHYHKIGLLMPNKVSEAGYRLYGQKELERLQEILFYRELDFSLADIQKAISDESNRIEILSSQRKLLSMRMRRLECLIKTLDDSILHTKRGEIMDKNNMFKGLSETEWRDALTEQSDYLDEKYGHSLLENNSIQARELNKMAQEATQYLNSMVQLLKDGVSHKDEKIKRLLSDHVDFLNKNGHTITSKGFLEQTRFLVEDDFHRRMLEGMQVGLSYYLLAAAESYAVK